MGASLLPPSGWAQLKRASEAGVSDPVLAKKYDVSERAIRVRRHREKWMTPERLEEMKQERAMKESNKRVATGAMKRMKQGDDGEGGMGHVVEEIATLAESGSLHFARLAESALRRKKSLTIRTVGDAVAAAKGLRSVAGLDKEAVVTMNFGAWGANSIRDIGGDLYDP
jgi:hypothetical protein